MIPEESESIQHFRATWKFLKDGLITFFYHVGASLDCRSIVDAKLLAGRTCDTVRVLPVSV